MLHLFKKDPVQPVLIIKSKKSRIRDKSGVRCTIITLKFNKEEYFYVTTSLAHERIKKFPLEALTYITSRINNANLIKLFRENKDRHLKINSHFYLIEDISEKFFVNLIKTIER